MIGKQKISILYTSDLTISNIFHENMSFDYLDILKFFYSAATICYPQLLVRSRMQDQHRKYETMRGCVSATFKNEGIQGFYKGLTTNLCRTVPASIFTFYTYEFIKKSQK